MKKRIISMLLTLIMVAGVFTGTALTVAASSSNETPFVPWVPETPVVPDTPDTPDAPDVPVTPDTPETPDTPDTPVVPDTPDVPVTPDTPAVPDTPDVPDTPIVPDIPDTPETPNTPDVPDRPVIIDPPRQPNLPDSTQSEPEQEAAKSAADCTRDNTCPMVSFTDLDRKAWYHDGIHYCIENGLMNGMSASAFVPDATLTRAMLVTVLWRLEGEPIVNYLMPFTDIPADEWYTEAVRWAAAEDIVNGYGNDTFGPANDVTREQIMAILHRYAAYRDLDSGVIFPMIPQYSYSQWAENDILWADMIGLTDVDVDIFDMTVPATRAEIAAYLMKFCVGFGME